MKKKIIIIDVKWIPDLEIRYNIRSNIYDIDIVGETTETSK